MVLEAPLAGEPASFAGVIARLGSDTRPLVTFKHLFSFLRNQWLFSAFFNNAFSFK